MKYLYLMLIIVALLVPVAAFDNGGGSSPPPAPTVPEPTIPTESDPNDVLYSPSHPDYWYFQDKTFGLKATVPVMTQTMLGTTTDVSGMTTAECFSVSGITRDSSAYQCIGGFEPALPDAPYPLYSFRSDAKINWGEHCDLSDIAGRSCSLRLGAGYTGVLDCDNYLIDESKCFNLFDPATADECGNGVVDPGEECDYAAPNPGVCSKECTLYTIDCSFVTTIEEACYCEDGGTGKNKYLSETIDGNLEDTSGYAAGVQTTGCCGDENTEWTIPMNTFPIREPDGSLNSYSGVYACCDNSDDCVYKGECYNLGEVITPNPRYICGPLSTIREATDFDYVAYAGSGEIKEATVPTVGEPENQFETQRTPTYAADYISCNSVESNLPQIWTPIDQCSGTTDIVGNGPGRLDIKVIDGASGLNIRDTDVTVRLELYRTGISGNTAYDANRVYRTLDDTTDGAGNIPTIEPLLGTYYTVVVYTDDGYVGVLSPVRVNYDDGASAVVEVYKDNGCFGCVDYGNSELCSASCEGRSLLGSHECSFPSSEISDACNLRAPGTIVNVDGMRIECCPISESLGWDRGYAIQPLAAKITCPSGTSLVTKEYIQSDGYKQTKIKVTICE